MRSRHQRRSSVADYLYIIAAAAGFIIVGTLAIHAFKYAYLWLFGSLKLSYSFGWPWWTLFAAGVLVCLPYVPDVARGLGKITYKPPGLIKKVLHMIGAALMIPLFAGMTVFMSVPWFIHQFVATKDVVEVTITEKRPGYTSSRGGCSPYVRFEGYPGETLCLSRSLYHRVQVGDTLVLEGRVSRFGITPRYAQLAFRHPVNGQLLLVGEREWVWR